MGLGNCLGLRPPILCTASRCCLHGLIRSVVRQHRRHLVSAVLIALEEQTPTSVSDDNVVRGTLVQSVVENLRGGLQSVTASARVIAEVGASAKASAWRSGLRAILTLLLAA